MAHDFPSFQIQYGYDMDIYIAKLDCDFLINQQITRFIAAIDEFKGRWNAIEKRENRYLQELRNIATVESIGSSTRIEGATLGDQEVRQLLKNVKITQLRTRDEQEVIGYYEVLELIFDNFSDMAISENYIKQLHQILLKHSDKDERHRGKYKNLPNTVVATYPTGEQKTIFATTEPALVENEMGQVIEWANRQWAEKTIHPLVTLAVFIYEFLSIHPFQDGNGRLSRLLTTLCLLRQGYEFIRYISFENHIENHKRSYYQALMSGQRHRHTPEEKIEQWLLFFLESLAILTGKLEKKYDVFKAKGGYLNERQKQVKAYIDQHQPVKAGDVLAAFPATPASTLKKDLRYLRDEQIILSVGRGKSTVYVAK